MLEKSDEIYYKKNHLKNKRPGKERTRISLKPEQYSITEFEKKKEEKNGTEENESRQFNWVCPKSGIHFDNDGGHNDDADLSAIGGVSSNYYG